MKKFPWLLLFIVVLAIEIAAVIINNQFLQFVFKPLLMPMLAGYLLSELKSENSGLKKWILAAIFFSWVGDILLMLVDKDPEFFLAGLISFLVAHIFYVLTFFQFLRNEKVKIRVWIMIVVAASYLLLMIWLSPYLGEMKWPVRIYGFVICTMLFLAMHLSYIKFKSAGILVMYGALLFVISDFLIATNKFYGSLGIIGFLIMLTYGLAQLLIIVGTSYYLRTVKST